MHSYKGLTLVVCVFAAWNLDGIDSAAKCTYELLSETIVLFHDKFPPSGEQPKHCKLAHES